MLFCGVSVPPAMQSRLKKFDIQPVFVLFRKVFRIAPSANFHFDFFSLSYVFRSRTPRRSIRRARSLRRKRSICIRLFAVFGIGGLIIGILRVAHGALSVFIIVRLFGDNAYVAFRSANFANVLFGAVRRARCFFQYFFFVNVFARSGKNGYVKFSVAHFAHVFIHAVAAGGVFVNVFQIVRQHGNFFDIHVLSQSPQ